MLKKSLFFLISMLLLSIYPVTAFASSNQKVYDFAELLNSEELVELEDLANYYSDESQIDIVILTTDDTEGRDVVKYMQDFYDEKGLGYNEPFGDTVILTVDMQHREVYVAGFYKGEEYIDDFRADIIRQEITPDLSGGYYFDAFQYYIELTNEYMGIEPGSEPGSGEGIVPGNRSGVTEEYSEDNIFSELWFQIVVSMIVAGIAVGVMAYNSAGRKTTNARTYLDEKNSTVTKKRDMYVRTAVTKVKKPSSKNSGGGGTTGGGHSHSGSRGSF